MEAGCLGLLDIGAGRLTGMLWRKAPGRDVGRAIGRETKQEDPNSLTEGGTGDDGGMLQLAVPLDKTREKYTRNLLDWLGWGGIHCQGRHHATGSSSSRNSNGSGHTGGLDWLDGGSHWQQMSCSTSHGQNKRIKSMGRLDWLVWRVNG